MGTFVLKKASDNQFHFRLQADNGENILSSELYASKSGAQNGIESVRTNAPIDAHYERKSAKNGQPMFNLKAANHEVIGTSETYTTDASRDNGIASVKKNAPKATVDDQT
jgi:uncharacterized protein